MMTKTYEDGFAEGFERGFKAGKAASCGTGHNPYLEIIRRQEEMFKRHPDSTGNPPVIDTHKVICTSPYIDRSRR